MKLEINFNDFIESNISGKYIINSFWLEHLMNLFCQGYITELWEEIQDTKLHQCENIESVGYGILNETMSNIVKDLE